MLCAARVWLLRTKLLLLLLLLLCVDSYQSTKWICSCFESSHKGPGFQDLIVVLQGCVSVQSCPLNALANLRRVLETTAATVQTSISATRRQPPQMSQVFRQPLTPLN